MDPIKYIQEKLLLDRSDIAIKAGDNINVSLKIKEGEKERIQNFKGDIIKITGTGRTKTVTVRKISNGVGVERIFPLNSPSIEEITVLKKGKVRRARIFYLRNLSGKKARIKEKKMAIAKPGADTPAGA